jgi:DeoR/GlpR family transcriptional regulator of sugar metabolism
MEKAAIVAKVLDLIGDHQTIFIDGGTTNLLLAKLIADRTGLKGHGNRISQPYGTRVLRLT